MKFLINELLDVQEKYGYLPENEIKRISKEFKVPLSNIYSIATFYRVFSLKPKRVRVQVCMGTACIVKGSALIKEQFEKNGVEVEEVRCLGACSLSPVVVIDGEIRGKVNVKNLGNLIKQLNKN